MNIRPMRPIRPIRPFLVPWKPQRTQESAILK